MIRLKSVGAGVLTPSALSLKLGPMGLCDESQGAIHNRLEAHFTPPHRECRDRPSTIRTASHSRRKATKIPHPCVDNAVFRRLSSNYFLSAVTVSIL